MITKNSLTLLSVFLIGNNFSHSVQGLNEVDVCVISGTQQEGICTEIDICNYPCAEKLPNETILQRCKEDESGELPLVCCPQLKRYMSISAAKCQEYKESACNISYYGNLPNSFDKKKVSNCAFTSDAVILGGSEAKHREFPHMALIGWKAGNEIEWKCGGSLISHKFVLSAAHCIQEKNGTIIPHFVRLGEHNMTDETESQTVELRAVEFYTHKNRTKGSSYHDIVLIEVDSPVMFNHAIRPVCLPQESTLPETAIATGWGHTNATQQSDVLLKVSVDIHSHSACFNRYPDNPDMLQGVQKVSQFCAGSANRSVDTCSGDSGGPLQIYHKDFFCSYTIVGVTLKGYACSGRLENEYSSALYTKVFPYLKLIESIVWPEASSST